MKAIKILKGLAFITTGVVLFGVKLYDITHEIFDEEIRGMREIFSPLNMQRYFYDYFQATGINVILAILFIGIGILELLELKGVKTDGN